MKIDLLKLKIVKMKKLIIGVIVFLALGISYAFTSSESINLNSNQVSIESYGCTYGQCYATAKSTGNRCQHCVSNQGDFYCWQHK